MNKEKKRATHLSWMIVLPLVATSGVTDREWDREEWESTGECILTYVSSSHYIKHRNMIIWNEIEENKNRQQWCIQVWNQKKKKKAHTPFTESCFATACNYFRSCWLWVREGRMRNYECKYRATEANILNKVKPMVDLH